MNAIPKRLPDTSPRRTVSHAEFLAELEAQGVPRHHCAFRCVICGNIQSAFSLSRFMTPDQAANRCYFSCEGRYNNGAHGCDWTLGGLLRVHTLEVIADDGTHIPAFEPASPEEAQTLMRVMQGKALAHKDLEALQ
ncbi:hypothetical protein LJC15_00055 [Desulfovibrio sp. OttesenSCG-928-G11]|nr:hypothetical protein [Desulfovibrio sp. OttesenSCG-928-G11]